MKRLDWKYLPIGVLFVLSTALAPVFRAQEGITVTRVRTDPPDAYYSVDATPYNSPSSSVWAPNSKHTLYAIPVQTPPGKPKTRYTFQGWLFGSNSLPTNPIAVTASPLIPEFLAQFNVEHALTLVYYDCGGQSPCQTSPGKIYAGPVPYDSSAENYYGQGSSVILQAVPNDGYVFVEWKPGPNQAILGLQNTVTMKVPVEVYPKFSPARRIYFESVPRGLQVLADRAPLNTLLTDDEKLNCKPSSVVRGCLDWAFGTVHSVGPISPQQDRFGKYWSFKSWSDGGAANHAYQVGGLNTPDTLTATYVPAAGITILTQPQGLPIKVDGIVNAVLTPLNPYFFTWGVGEKHRIEAPQQQTDAQGRVWKFSSWSNAGAASQDFTVPDDADTGGARLTATYTAMAKLTVTSAVGALNVTVDGADCAVPCEVLRDMGAKVRLSVPASIAQGDGSRLDFNGWPGGAVEYVATLTESLQTVSASYRTMNRFTAASDPPNGAVWRVEPASGDGFYNTEAMVAVNLTAQPGFKFRRWDGDLSGTIPSGVVAMNAPRVVRALLEPVPYIAPTGVSNAAGVTPVPAVASGSIISIFGANLASGTAAAGDGILPQTLAGVTSRVGDRLLPLVFASATQINAVLPDDLPEGKQLLAVTPPGQAEVRVLFTVQRNAPGLFGTVLHEDGSAVSPEAPARAGELLTVYGTGFGPADHARLAGFPIPASPEYLIADGVEVRLGDAVAVVEKAFAAPGRVGIDAVRFRLGEGTASGALKVVVNGVESNTVTVAVQ